MWLKVKKLLLGMLRRIHVETDKDPFHEMLRRINVETDKDPIHDMLRRINEVESEETAS